MDNARAPRRERVNIRVRKDLKDLAKQEGLNISRIAEEALERALTDVRKRRFYEENKAAINAYNTRVEREGLWCDDYRLL